MRSASRGMTAKFEGLVQNYSGLVVALVVLFFVIFVVGMATAPNFLTVFNLKTIVRDAALVGIMAIGLTFPKRLLMGFVSEGNTKSVITVLDCSGCFGFIGIIFSVPTHLGNCRA